MSSVCRPKDIERLDRIFSHPIAIFINMTERFKKLFLYVFLVLMFCNVSFADKFNWTRGAVLKDGTATLYIDKTTIRKVEDYKYVWLLTNFEKYKKNDTGAKSIIAHTKVNCVNLETQTLVILAYDSRFGEGEIIYHDISDNEEELAREETIPGSIIDIAVSEICK